MKEDLLPIGTKVRLRADSEYKGQDRYMLDGNKIYGYGIIHKHRETFGKFQYMVQWFKHTHVHFNSNAYRREDLDVIEENNRSSVTGFKVEKDILL